MNFLAWVGQALELIPQAIEVGKRIAEAIRPSRTIDAKDATLWHTVTYGRGLMFCTVCQRWVTKVAELCPEAVRRRTQD